jgi:hypothetical protein
VSSDDADERPPGEIPDPPPVDGTDPEDIGPGVPTAPGSEDDPEQLGPEIPTPPEPTAGDADSESVRLFWKLVLVFNVAVFGLSVGPMIGVFLDNWDLGLQVFAVGALAAAYGLVRYYGFRRDRETNPDESD